MGLDNRLPQSHAKSLGDSQGAICVLVGPLGFMSSKCRHCMNGQFIRLRDVIRDESNLTFHQSGNEMNIFHELVELGNSKCTSMFATGVEGSTQLRVLSKRISTFARFNFIELAKQLPCSAIEKVLDSFLLRFKTKAGCSLVSSAGSDVADKFTVSPDFNLLATLQGAGLICSQR